MADPESPRCERCRQNEAETGGIGRDPYLCADCASAAEVTGIVLARHEDHGAHVLPEPVQAAVQALSIDALEYVQHELEKRDLVLSVSAGRAVVGRDYVEIARVVS